MRAVIYARFSSSSQQETSIEFQVKDCTDFANRHGYDVVKVFADIAKSATTANRPKFREMIRFCLENEVDAVICWKRDRFARSRIDSAVYKEKLKEKGIKVLYSQESNIDSADGIIMDAVMEGVAEWYSANLSANIRKGNAVAAQHHWTLGTKVFGLKKGDDKTFVIDEETAPVVRKIFTAYSEGVSIKDIIEMYPQYHFKRHTLARMLSNEKYYGRYNMYGVDEMCIPPIISKELFDEVQKKLATHAQSPNAKETEYILSGKLFCGKCGTQMVADSVNKADKTYRYYCCVGRKKHLCDMDRYNQEELEMMILNKIKEVIQDDSVINQIADRFMAWQDSRDFSELENEKKTLQVRVDNLWKVLEKTGDTEVYDRIAPLKKRIQEIEDQLVQERGYLFTHEQICAWFRQFRICYDEKEWNKELVRNFLYKAFVYPDKIIVQTTVTKDELPVDSSTLKGLVDISVQKSNIFIVIRKEVAGG